MKYKMKLEMQILQPRTSYFFDEKTRETLLKL